MYKRTKTGRDTIGVGLSLLRSKKMVLVWDVHEMSWSKERVRVLIHYTNPVSTLRSHRRLALKKLKEFAAQKHFAMGFPGRR